MVDDKKITFSFNRSFVTYALVFLLVLIAFLLGSFQISPKNFLSSFTSSPNKNTGAITPGFVTNDIQKTATVVPKEIVIPTSLPFPTITTYRKYIEPTQIPNNQEKTQPTSNYAGGNYYYGCKNGACLRIPGIGSDNCSNSRQCVHYKCENDKCVFVNEPGADECYSDSYCYHSECSGANCIRVSGKGENQCSLNPDAMSGCTHFTCKDFQCVEVTGKGTDECHLQGVSFISGQSYNVSCGHGECQNNKCILVSGSGNSSCSVDANCQ